MFVFVRCYWSPAVALSVRQPGEGRGWFRDWFQLRSLCSSSGLETWQKLLPLEPDHSRAHQFYAIFLRRTHTCPSFPFKEDLWLRKRTYFGGRSEGRMGNCAYELFQLRVDYETAICSLERVFNKIANFKRISFHSLSVTLTAPRSRRDRENTDLSPFYFSYLQESIKGVLFKFLPSSLGESWKSN